VKAPKGTKVKKLDLGRWRKLLPNSRPHEGYDRECLHLYFLEHSVGLHFQQGQIALPLETMGEVCLVHRGFMIEQEKRTQLFWRIVALLLALSFGDVCIAPPAGSQSADSTPVLRREKTAVMPFLKGRFGSDLSGVLNCPLCQLSFDRENIMPGCDETLTQYLQEALERSTKTWLSRPIRSPPSMPRFQWMKRKIHPQPGSRAWQKAWGRLCPHGNCLEIP